MSCKDECTDFVMEVDERSKQLFGERGGVGFGIGALGEDAIKQLAAGSQGHDEVVCVVSLVHAD